MLRLMLAITLLLAGCAVPAEEPQAAEPATEQTEWPRVVEVYARNGSTTIGARELAIPENDALRFNTTVNLTGILVELAWSDAHQDLNTLLQADVEHCPKGNGGPVESVGDLVFCQVDGVFFGGFGAYRDTDGGTGTPDNPSRLLIQGGDLGAVVEACGDPCPWEAWVGAAAGHAKVDWTLYVSVFYGGEVVPTHYSAIP